MNVKAEFRDTNYKIFIPCNHKSKVVYVGFAKIRLKKDSTRIEMTLMILILKHLFRSWYLWIEMDSLAHFNISLIIEFTNGSSILTFLNFFLNMNVTREKY